MADTYITIPFDTDPEDILNDAYDMMQALIPGWQPSPGNLDVWILMAVASAASESRDVASEVSKSIFRWFGANLVNVPPVDAVQAYTYTTWTMADNLGHVIPGGTQVALADANGVVYVFETTADYTVYPGSTTTPAGAVEIIAIDPGADANGLGGVGATVNLLDSLSFVSSVVTTVATSAGQDAEGDDDYLNRLSATFELLAPRPILPGDFAVFARNVSGAWRAVAIDLWDPTASITGRTGTTTNASNQVTAISSMTGIVVGQTISGTNIPAGTYVIAVNTGASSLTMSQNATAGASGTALTFGGTGSTARCVTVVAVDQAGLPVSSTVKTAIDADLQARREVNFLVYEADAVTTQIDVTYSVKALAGYDLVALKADINAALTAYLSPATWGTTQEDERAWRLITLVRYLEVAQVINDTLGVDYIISMTTGIHLGTMGTVDITLPGIAPLPQANTLSGTVT